VKTQPLFLTAGTVRISPRTGRPVRRYDDSISTLVKALSFDDRAIRKLVTKWPEGARICPRDRAAYYEPWPAHLAAILILVLDEPWTVGSQLGYTPPAAREARPRFRGRRSVVAVKASYLYVSDLARLVSQLEDCAQ